ncbi:MAG: PKD domain-containing protein [Brachybacterium sp.]|nr:PKD domain-containing protein [Brachybacterium sp.]
MPDTSAGSTTPLRGTSIDTATGERADLGRSCYAPSEATTAAFAAPAAEAEVIEVVVTQQDFAALPIEPAVPNVGPPAGYLPVNMDLIVYAEAEEQTLQTTLLDTPVAVRAIPVSYHWDFGDGNTLTTDDPGRPHPHKDVTARYSSDGWYDVTLTTTYRGEYSVDGGAWQDIDGSVDVPSAPVAIYSRSLESRLVNPDRDHHDEHQVPDRSPATEGRSDPNPTHRHG